MASEMKNTEKLNSTPRYPKVLKVVGIVALLHVVLGFILAFASIAFVSPFHFSHLDEASMIKQMEMLPDALKQIASEFGLSQILDIISSSEVRVYYWTMILLGFVFNGTLLLIGYQFVCAKLNLLWYFVGLMVCYLGYTIGFQILVSPESDAALKFSAAWGVGNMGLHLLVLTHFWLWGPLLAVFGAKGFPQKP